MTISSNCTSSSLNNEMEGKVVYSRPRSLFVIYQLKKIENNKDCQEKFHWRHN